ncbi:MAG TPA: hypothetical protein VKB50_29045 [Vicinamibacterales bacterium]|nr:hypothetical protein [Vicinamibacterales bacterium]
MKVRRLVPRPVRHRVSAQLARMQGRRLDRDLERLASAGDTIVAGPWLGEVGFELLYWVPFLRWFAEAFQVAPERLLVVSRGGTAAWYRPFAANYREIFDYLSPEEFRRHHDERVTANGEQKQTRVMAFEHDLLRELTTDVRSRSMLHPSSMFTLFNPFWWGHVGDRWVHQRARYCELEASASSVELPSQPYTAVKFYFNECFPATERNRAFVRETLHVLAADGPVISLATGLHLDDHAHDDPAAYGVKTMPSDIRAQDNLAMQNAVVAGASRFVGTYGGFSYLAPFLGVRALAFYDDPDGYSKRHLLMAQSAFRAIGKDGFLDVRSTTHTAAALTH